MNAMFYAETQFGLILLRICKPMEVEIIVHNFTSQSHLLIGSKRGCAFGFVRPTVGQPLGLLILFIRTAGAFTLRRRFGGDYWVESGIVDCVSRQVVPEGSARPLSHHENFISGTTTTVNVLCVAASECF
jgi:hypothetical protein